MTLELHAFTFEVEGTRRIRDAHLAAALFAARRGGCVFDVVTFWTSEATTVRVRVMVKRREP